MPDISKDVVFPWGRLPDELKLKVLLNCLRMPVTCARKFKQDIMSLLLTSKRMYELCQEVWGHNQFFMPFTNSSIGNPSHYPRPPGRHCRKLHAHFQVTGAPDLSLPSPNDASTTHGSNENLWCYLLDPLDATGASKTTSWQQGLTNLRRLTITICVNTMTHQVQSGDALCFGDQNSETFLHGLATYLRADEVIVNIRGLSERTNLIMSTEGPGFDVYDPERFRHCPHRCAERLARELKTMMERAS